MYLSEDIDKYKNQDKSSFLCIESVLNYHIFVKKVIAEGLSNSSKIVVKMQRRVC
jgi:hypothetical protein